MTAPRVGIVCSRFPKLSETFVLEEAVELERQGVDVVPMPLRLERVAVAHPGARRLAARARAAAPWSRAVLGAQVRCLRRDPAAYLGVWRGVLVGLRASPAMLVRALVVVPLAVRMAEVAREERLDRLHAHYATHPALACWVVRRLTGLPWSMTVHAHDLYVDQTMFREKADDAAFVVAVTQRNRRLVEELAPGARVEVVRCGVDVDLLRPAARRLPGRPPLVVCVASLQAYKGHRHLLDAVALLRDGGTDVRLELAGTGELRGRLGRQVRRLGLQDRVTFAGPLDRDGVRALLARADLFALASIVLPSGKVEGLPVAIMEALACGLPVVATAVSGVPELVANERTGLLVAPGDPAALAAALDRLLGDPLLAERLGRAGREAVLSAHDRRREVARLAALLGAGRFPASMAS